jgi:hypothetical protein
MEIIQDSLNFVNSQTSKKDGVDTTSIENISDEEISRGLMVNASMIILRKMRPKILCQQLDEEVAIPRVIRGDEEEVFIEKIFIDGTAIDSTTTTLVVQRRI